MSQAQLAQQKVTSLLGLPIKDEQFGFALRELDAVHPADAGLTRSQLRSSIEQRTVDLAESFVRSFEEVKKGVDELEAAVAEMKGFAASMQARLDETRREAADMLTEAEAFRGKRSEMTAQYEAAAAFVHRFHLSEEEMRAFSEGPVQADFYAVMERIETIKSDCQAWLKSGRLQRADLGLEIMETMARHEQNGFDRLYRWAKFECQNLGARTNGSMHPALPRALALLHKRDVLLGYCLQEISKARGHVVTREFLQALQRGGPGGLPKPIEIHAHDPLRYAGEMLGWLHQTAASEFDLVQHIFEEEQKTNVDDDDDSKQQQQQMVVQLMARTFEGVCELFASRVRPLVTAQRDVVVVLQLQHLLDFYEHAMCGMMGSESLLPSTIRETKRLALATFARLARHSFDGLESSPQTPSASLRPVPGIERALQQLAQMLDITDAAMSPSQHRRTDDNDDQSSDDRYRPVFESVVDPLIRAATLSATRLDSHLDISVFLLNCFARLDAVLAGCPAARHKRDLLHAKIEAHLATLVDHALSRLLGRMKIGVQLLELQAADTTAALAARPAMDAASLQPALREFEAALFDMDNQTVAGVDKLADPAIARRAIAQLIQQLVQLYEALYRAVTDPQAGYSEPQTIFKYTPDQIRQLCQ